jgi:ABC-2 type transport system ATP-binding protein
MTGPVVRIQNLTKTFGRVRALDAVSFDIPQHSIFGILGPNGAGKTTLFSILANFLKADAGAVEVLGFDARRVSHLRGRLTILPQDAQFQRNLPILDQLAFFQRLAGRTKPESEREVMQTLALVGLDSVAKRRVTTLSHGMVKRLGIAQAFLGNPEVILLDEPTAGLDPANARQIRDLVKTLQAQATIAVSSHNLAEIQELCDHVAILDRGKLVLAAPVEEITRAGREYRLTLSRRLTDIELSRLRTLAGVRSLTDTAGAPARRTADYSLTLDMTDGRLSTDEVIAGVLRLLLDLGVTPRELSEGRSLETRFLEVTRGEIGV